jgi:hypothetical protein
MKILVIDGQGGRIGRTLVEEIMKAKVPAELYAVGTNSMATAAMMKGGAVNAATGENPVIVNCKDADIITGPIGILSANSLLGEITPKIALSVSESKALKLLIPMNRCNIWVAGNQDQPLADAIAEILAMIQKSI